MRQKRAGIFILCLCLLAAAFSGCGRVEKETPVLEKQLSVYASFYPIYAIADMITADVPDLKLNCLVQPQDGCLRNYQLSEWDLALLMNSADIVFCGGSGLESFDSVLYSLGENGPAVASVFYNMELMEQSAAGGSADGETHWDDPNPHIYMRAEAAVQMAESIAASMQILDAENSGLYKANLENAVNELNTLAEEIKSAAQLCEGTPVAVMNEALVYSAADLSLDIALCYDRDSGEDMDLYELDNCLKLLAGSGAQIVLIEKQAPAKLCSALEDAGYAVVRMENMSTRRADEGAEGYFAAQRENVQAVLAALTAAAADA